MRKNYFQPLWKGLGGSACCLLKELDVGRGQPSELILRLHRLPSRGPSPGLPPDGPCPGSSQRRCAARARVRASRFSVLTLAVE